MEQMVLLPAFEIMDTGSPLYISISFFLSHCNNVWGCAYRSMLQSLFIVQKESDGIFVIHIIITIRHNSSVN